MDWLSQKIPYFTKKLCARKLLISKKKAMSGAFAEKIAYFTKKKAVRKKITYFKKKGNVSEDR